MYHYLLILSLMTLASTCRGCACTVNITTIEAIGRGQLNGPEAIAVDSQGYIYVGINDGSVRRIDPVTLDITLYAYSIPTLANRSNCGQLAYESVCGRVLGLKFDSSDNLYAVDAYNGLLKFPRSNPGNVQQLSNSSNGVTFKLTNSLLIDETESCIYFTETSSVYPRTDFVTILLEASQEGRLLRYDIQQGVTTTLFVGLVFGNGIAFNDDETYIVMVETTLKRLVRYFLKGSNKGTTDVFTKKLHAYPDNIEFDHVSGNFLVGCYSLESPEVDFVIKHKALAALMVKNVPPAQTLSLIPNRGVVKVVDHSGDVVKTMLDPTGALIHKISEGKRIGNYIYLASVMNNFLARMPAYLLDNPQLCL